MKTEEVKKDLKNLTYKSNKKIILISKRATKFSLKNTKGDKYGYKKTKKKNAK